MNVSLKSISIVGLSDLRFIQRKISLTSDRVYNVAGYVHKIISVVGGIMGTCNYYLPLDGTGYGRFKG